jgi:hypothetical protein
MAPKSPQKPTLDDNAENYKRREHKSEKQKLSEMEFTEKVAYFKCYYLKKLLAALVIGGFLIWIIITVVMPKPDRVFSLAFVDYPILQEDIDKIEAELTKLLNVNPDSQEIFIDTSFQLNDYASVEKLTVYTYSGEIDIFIAPASQFIKYAFSGAMCPLTDLLPTDLYSTLKASDLFVCKTRENNDEEVPEQATGPEGVYGIYLKDLDMFDFFDTSTDPPVIGVMVTSKNKENATSYLKYLFKK